MKVHAHYASGFTIMQFNHENGEIGRLWQDGGQLKFEGNADEAAQQLFKHVIKENNGFLSVVEEQNNRLHGELLAMEHDRDHWKANHDHQVEAARVLKSRRDIPVERKMLYEALSSAGLEDCAKTPEAKGVVTNTGTLDHVLDVYAAARKLVSCKGRYHAEQNYRALAELFGVTVPDLPPLASDDIPDDEFASSGRLVSADTWQKIQDILDAPAAPTEALRELMTREPRFKRES